MKSRKELQSEYRQHKTSMGVFRIMNLENGRVCIEGSIDIDARWNRHRSELKFGSHKNIELQKDWNTHGSDQFEFSVLSNLEYSTTAEVDYSKEIKELFQLVMQDLEVNKELIY